MPPTARSTFVKGPTPPKLPRARTAAQLPDHDLDDEAELEGLSYSGLDLAERETELIHIDGCRFGDVDLSGTTLSRSTLSDCVLETCNLANLAGESSGLVRTSVQGSRATGLRWIDGTLRHVSFTRSRMDLAVFWSSRFDSVRFENCHLAQADFHDADLTGAHFVDCDLTGARLAEARMTGTRLERCVLDGISGVTSLRGAILDADDLLGLTYALADGLGIVIAERAREE